MVLDERRMISMSGHPVRTRSYSAWKSCIIWIRCVVRTHCARKKRLNLHRASRSVIYWFFSLEDTRVAIDNCLRRTWSIWRPKFAKTEWFETCRGRNTSKSTWISTNRQLAPFLCQHAHSQRSKTWKRGTFGPVQNTKNGTGSAFWGSCRVHGLATVSPKGLRHGKPC